MALLSTVFFFRDATFLHDRTRSEGSFTGVKCRWTMIRPGVIRSSDNVPSHAPQSVSPYARNCIEWCHLVVSMKDCRATVVMSQALLKALADGD